MHALTGGKLLIHGTFRERACRWHSTCWPSQLAQQRCTRQPQPGSQGEFLGNQHANLLCRSSPYSSADYGAAMRQYQDAVAALRADPVLRRILDSPRVASALRDIASNPSAISHYQSDTDVVAVLSRLAEAGLPPSQAAQIAELGHASPRDAFASVFGDASVSAVLASPRVRQALAEIRQDPVGGMAKWERDAEVVAALDLLEARLGGAAGGGGVIDVQAS